MVILKSTAVPGLPLNLVVEVKTVLIIYFERHARRAPLDSFRAAQQRPKKNPVSAEQAMSRRRAVDFFFLKKGTKVASSYENHYERNLFVLQIYTAVENTVPR